MDGYIYVKEDYLDQLKEENEELKNENEELKKERDELHEALDNMSGNYQELIDELEYRAKEHQKLIDKDCKVL